MTSHVEQVLKFISRDEEEQHTERMAKQLGMGYINLVSYPILPDILRIIPEDVATSHHIISYLKVQNTLRLATSRPANPLLSKILGALKDTHNLDVQLLLCSETSIRSSLALYTSLPLARSSDTRVMVTEKEDTQWQADIADLSDLKKKITAIPTTKLLDVVLAGALHMAASDIHLEPTEDGLRLRYRIDGVLVEIAMLQKEAFKALRSRIKFLANLKLDVTTTPQDGRFAAEALGKPLDVRVSLIPGGNGEFITLRLLLHDQMLLSLDQLAMRPEALAVIREAIKKPHGIIFNTGPTGSGKTTTLYAVLGQLNKPGVKIITLEDPIEYKIPGINQSQVEVTKGYDFATGLRSVLRQDPDIILVGEIRDQETAATAVQASLTGHLVLTTLHTNSAAAALPRLIDMGVQPFLLAGAVNLIIGQRLVRRICATCKGKGCTVCNSTGFKGRVALVETLVPNEAINKLITDKAPLVAFEQAAKASGMVTMEQDGMEKVKQGLTTRDEVLRVTRE